MKLSEYIEKFGDGTLVDIYDKEQIKQLSGVGKVKYIAIVEDKVFVPKENERYCFVNDIGEVACYYNNQSMDKSIIDCQQVYRTEAEAEFARDKAIFKEFMRKEFLRNSDELDWKDKYQLKYYLEYNHFAERVDCEFIDLYQVAEFHTTNKNWLKNFTKKYEDEIKKYYFEVEV